MKIGFFDTGLGGITILKKAINNMPAEYIYLADNLHSPYGTKNYKEVLEFTSENIKTLINLGCNMIVIACNTATAVSIEALRKKYNNIVFIGTEPAVKPAILNSNNKKIIVTATSLTLKQNRFKNLITSLNAKNIVELLPLDNLVKYADCNEEIDYASAKKYLENILKNYKLDDYSSIVLGCTHFPIFKKELEELLPANMQILDSSDGVIKRLKYIFLQKNIKPIEKSSYEIFLTKEDENFKNKAVKYINGRI